MSPRIIIIGLLAALAVAPACLGGDHERDRKRSPVPPTQEIEILDPNVDPLGNPAVLTESNPDHPGQATISIPPSVIVHRFFYSGDRTFQGPMFPGGPSIVVATHPKTGERVYVPVQMPPGAPRVTYRYDFIQYDFGHQAIFVRFGHHGKANVTFREGVTVAERIREKKDEARQKTRDAVAAAGQAAGGHKLAEASHNVAVNAGSGLKKIGAAAVSPVKKIIGATPLANLAKPPQDAALKQRDKLVDQAQTEATRLEQSIPTIR